MQSTIRLFKAVPINTKKKKINKELMEATIQSGYIFSPEVLGNYGGDEIVKLMKSTNDILGLSSAKMNQAFHKSWKKIKEANIEQLVMEQIVHYMTTYGFEAMGIYSDSSVYIPPEKLEIPELKEGVALTVIKGYTKKELKEKLLNLLQSGIALKDQTRDDVVDVALYVELNTKEVESIKNKETKIILYDYIKVLPENPVELLRYIVYKATEKTLLIKDKASIEAIKTSDNSSIYTILVQYKNAYGLERLGEIFYRFKPLFLAFKKNKKIAKIINKIRKHAVKNHLPLKEDYLNTITAKLKNNLKLDYEKLEVELNRVNIFRKIRLAYALKYRTKHRASILYRIRNGKSYATSFSFDKKITVKKVYNIVVDSIVKDVSKNVKGKKIYIPEHICYALPTTEKMFTGYFPSGTYVKMSKDMIFGVHWEDVDDHRIDLDLSLINSDIGKIGWDGTYRTEASDILFSGDLTSAPKPHGASELFYVKKQAASSYMLMINYYNFSEDIEVPYKIIVGKGCLKNQGKNYMLDPNDMVTIAPSIINKKQKMFGLLTVVSNECRFYFAETIIGNAITSSGKDYVEHSRRYLFDFYKNAVTLQEILEKAGAKMQDSAEKCDIDLSPEKVEKDTIINLLKE